MLCVLFGRGYVVRVFLVFCFVILFFVFSPLTVIINKTTMGDRSGHRRDITPGQARLVTARFVLRQLHFFFLAEVPHYSCKIRFESNRIFALKGGSSFSRKTSLLICKYILKVCRYVCDLFNKEEIHKKKSSYFYLSPGLFTFFSSHIYSKLNA